jgi:hypothetical protein
VASSLWLSLPGSVLGAAFFFLDGGVVGARLACVADRGLAFVPGLFFLGGFRATSPNGLLVSSSEGCSPGMLPSSSGEWGCASFFLRGRGVALARALALAFPVQYADLQG